MIQQKIDQTNKEMINFYSKIFVFILLLSLSIYFNSFWLWFILLLNTTSDFIYPIWKDRKKLQKGDNE